VSDCQAIRSSLGRFLDGELSPAEAAGIKAHVQGCSACRQEVQALLSIAARLDAIVVPPVPADSADAIMARVHATAPWRQRMFDFWQAWPPGMRIAAIGAATAACLIGVTLGSAFPSTRPDSTRSDLAWVDLASGETFTSAYLGITR
jgi:anti-sigma factor RsiW